AIVVNKQSLLVNSVLVIHGCGVSRSTTSDNGKRFHIFIDTEFASDDREIHNVISIQVGATGSGDAMRCWLRLLRLRPPLCCHTAESVRLQWRFQSPARPSRLLSRRLHM